MTKRRSDPEVTQPGTVQGLRAGRPPPESTLSRSPVRHDRPQPGQGTPRAHAHVWGQACPGASTQGCHWPHKEEPSSLWAPWCHCLLPSLAALGTTAQDQGCPRVTQLPGVTSTRSGSTALLSPAPAREDCGGPRGRTLTERPLHAWHSLSAWGSC